MKIQAAIRLKATAVHPEVQRVVDRTRKELKRLFPKADRTFKGFVFLNVNHPSYDPWERVVKVPIFGKDRPLAEVDREENLSDSTVLHYGFRGMLIHEYAHHVDHFIRAKGKDEVKDGWFDTKRRLQKQLGNPSLYAGTNISEWVAEQFLAEIVGFRPKFLIPEIQKLMDKI